jgi:hypothetical protein
MSVILHMLIRASMGSFPAAFATPSHNRELDTFLHSAEVVTYTHERSTLCCTTRHTFPSKLLFVWGPVDDPSQSPFFSMTPQTHPFVSPSSPIPHMHTDWCTGPHLYPMDAPTGRIFRTQMPAPIKYG